MESFEDILDKVVQACEGLDDAQIEETLNKLMAEEGFNEEEKGFVEETFELLDASAEKYDDLQKAKEDGEGRQEWLTKQFDKMLEGRSEEEVDTFMKAVDQATNDCAEKELAQEEESEEANSSETDSTPGSELNKEEE